ncbi:hypothetical protein [Hugenholtzia roseola]|uniref:hypothetical protein n=1 Tax=Hugenholtzia roseola TaxID=1002 RepID=UPI00042846C5|nr:hypothetical protein [Hugenholtzia roseola]
MKTKDTHIHILTNEADEFVGVELSAALWQKVAHYVYQQAQRLDYEPFTQKEKGQAEPIKKQTQEKQEEKEQAQKSQPYNASQEEKQADEKEKTDAPQSPTTLISIIKQEANGNQVVISKKITTQKKEHDVEQLRKKLEALADFLKNNEQ